MNHHSDCMLFVTPCVCAGSVASFQSQIWIFLAFLVMRSHPRLSLVRVNGACAFSVWESAHFDTLTRS